MEKLLEFDVNNKAYLTSEEALLSINKEDKITIVVEQGFDINSDTEDVFRGLVGDLNFEESEEFIDAVHFNGKVQHTFFLSNAKEETPFNEKGMVKRLIQDGFWTSIILHNQPLKDGLYAIIQNKTSE